MDFIGTSGNDNYLGTVDADEFDMSQGGRDTVSGLEGDDVYLFGSGLRGNEQIDGGADHDTVVLAGNYLFGLVFGPTTMVNVEEIVCEAGFSYTLAIDDATATDLFFYVDAHTLAAGESLDFDGTAETAAIIDIEGGEGDDVLSVGYRGTFRLGEGGSDTAIGGSGKNTFFTYDDLDSTDVLVGGASTLDTVSIAGDYSAGLTITAAMMSSVELLEIFAAYNGTFIVEDAVTAAGVTTRLLMTSFTAPAGMDVTFDASAETDAFWNLQGGVSDDFFLGGQLGDEFDMRDAGSGGQGGDDELFGDDGDDVFLFDGQFTRFDEVDGGDGFDELRLEGDLSAGVNFAGVTMEDIEQLVLEAGFDYVLTVGDNNVNADGFTVLADTLGSADTLSYDGAAELGRDVIVLGGAGGDTVTTGGGAAASRPNTGAVGRTTDAESARIAVRSILGVFFITGGQRLCRAYGLGPPQTLRSGVAVARRNECGPQHVSRIIADSTRLRRNPNSTCSDCNC